MSSRTPSPADRSPSASGAAEAMGEAGTISPPAGTRSRRRWQPALLAASVRQSVRATASALRGVVRHPAWRRAGKILLRIALILAALALVSVLLIRYVLWPQASASREWLEHKGSSALSANVTIGHLETYWAEWHPAFRASDVRIVDSSQRVLLSAAGLEGRLSWHSLASLDLQFADVSSRGADLLVQRTPDGRLMVAGMSVDPAGSAPRNNRFLDWLLAQGRVDVTEGRLRWLDEKNGLPVLEVGNIRVRTERKGSQHRVRVEASSPTLTPQPVVLEAAFRHDYLTRVGDWHNWTGQASWRLAQLQLPAMQRYTALFERADGGTLSADGTIEFRDGRMARSQARLRGTGIDVLLSGASAPLRLTTLQALLMHRSDRAGDNQLTIDTLLWQPQASEAAQNTDAAWREGMRQVVLRWTADPQGQLRRFAVKAPTLDLNVLRALAATMPLESDVVKPLRAFQPSGRIDNLDVTWSRDRTSLLDARPGQAHFQFQGVMRDVSVREQAAVPAMDADGHPVPGVPGFNRLSGSFSFDDRQGRLRFEGNGATLQFPGVFEQPQLQFDELGGEVRWRREKGHLHVQSDGVRFANADTAGTVRGSWQDGGDGHSGVADMAGELERANVNRVPRYLPLTLPESTRHYLAGALVGGEARDVKFLVKGDLSHFPFRAPHEKAGDFRVEVPVHGVSYQIAPDSARHISGDAPAQAKPPVAPVSGATRTGSGVAPATAPWPVFTDIDGEVRFERGAMSFEARRATVQSIAGVTLRDVNGRIAELSPRGHLVVDGNATGTLQGFLRYLAMSPIGGWTGNVTTDTRAQGNGDLTLKLNLPLDHARDTRVQGQFRLGGNDIVVAPGAPALSGATGTVGFDEHGFRLDNVRARFLGGELRTAGGTQADGTIKVTASGTVSAQGIGEALSGTSLASAGKLVEGNASYSATIGVQDNAPVVTLTTDLAGMAMGLPAPLAKPAGQALPVRFEWRPLAGRSSMEDLILQYGPLVHARYLVRRTNDGLAVQAGAIGVQQSVAVPASGVVAGITLDRLDIDAWRGLLSPREGGERPAGGGRGGSRGPAEAWLPERITARAKVLHVFGRDLDDVSFEAVRATSATRTTGDSADAGDGAWQFQIDSRQIAGQMNWREDPANPSGALRMRLSRMVIPDTQDATHVVDALASKVDEIPAIDLIADRFELRGHDFGKLAVKAHTATVEGEPVWTLQELTIEQPGATLTSSGTWRVPRRMRDNANAQRRTLLNIDIDIRNAGDVLDRMGLAHTLRDGHGRLEGRVLWRGSPLSIDYPTLSGRLSLNLQNGQILNVDPGAAKLLGVLSLQSLLRLATFDFRSLAGEGFVFDEISGTGTIENGIGTTDDFRLKAPQAMASMSGKVDIPNETQDLTVALTPRINATSASVAAAFINPVLGIGTLAAQLLFADEFSKAFTQHYRVSGNWANPQISKVGENKDNKSVSGQGSSSGGERAVTK